VVFDGRSLRAAPDPAEVRAGTEVVWRFRSLLQSHAPVRWIIRFDRGSPFRDDHFVASATLDKEAETKPETPEDPGEWKYSIQLRDVASGKDLADEDPILKVTS
jgi:hypothetical protein